MAKCKLCKTNIPDGTEYCSSCQDKGNVKSNESYLDSLLNSVKNTTPTTESIYKKKNNSNSNSPEIVSNKTIENDPQDYDSYTVDLGDFEDFDQFNLDDDLGDLKNQIIIGDEELFGEDLSNIFADESNKDQEQDDLESKIAKFVEASEHKELTQEGFTRDTISPNLNQVGNFNNEEVIRSDNLQNNINQNEILEFHEDDSQDPDLNDLLNSLEDSKNDIEEQGMTDEDYLPLEDGIEPANLDEYDDFESNESEEDDFLSLLNQISSDDPVAADVKAIGDLLSGRPVEQQSKSNMPSDVGEVFSDALKVVSSLNDSDIDEFELLNKIPDKNNKKGKKKKKNTKKSNKDKVKSSPKEKSEKSLFKRLFGNVEDENAIKKEQSLKRSKVGESAATKEASKKGKPKKDKKNKKGTASIDDETLDDIRSGKERPGKEKPADNKDSKKDKKEKKKKTKEIIQVIDEIDEDESRINRLGASIVFLFFGLLVILLIVGTNVVSYTLSIQNATNYFDKQKYTQAYNEVYGIEIKDEDIEIYDKIMTVMFVNKQLNSYNSYYSMEKYPEALDSLLKGLSRYEKYIELATMLGIKTDLDYVRSQILAELNNVFNLSEREALQMIDYGSMDEYSLKVYDVVLEKMNN